MASADPVVVAKAIQCIASAVVDGGGSINVTIDNTIPPDYGTSAFTAVAVDSEGTTIPAGWSSFTVIAPVSNTAAISLNGSSALLPGMSLGHQAWEGYPGQAITVGVTGSDFAYVSWVFPS